MEVKTQNADTHQHYLNQSKGFDLITRNKSILKLLRFFFGIFCAKYLSNNAKSGPALNQHYGQ